MRSHPSADNRPHDSQLADPLAATPADETAPDRTPVAVAPDRAMVFAQRLLTVRRRRKQYLDNLWFGEPDWDILLDAFVASGSRRILPVSSLCIVADISVSTALRRINALILGGYLRRSRDLIDQRRSLVEITEIGEAKVRRCLEDIMSKLDVA